MFNRRLEKLRNAVLSVVNDIDAVLRRVLEVWTHHRVVSYHNCIWGSLFDWRADLEQRVGWGIEWNDGDLGR